MKTTKPKVSLARLWSVQALAEHWSTAEHTIRLWARRGEIPHIKIGTKVYFEHDVLVRFIEAKSKAAS